jgi:hypothetical protein
MDIDFERPREYTRKKGSKSVFERTVHLQDPASIPCTVRVLAEAIIRVITPAGCNNVFPTGWAMPQGHPEYFERLAQRKTH